MAACSPKEVAASLEVLRWLEEPVGLQVDIFDDGFELLRHIILEAWVEARASDREMLQPLLDLLTSLKFRSRDPILTATPLGGHMGFRACLEERPHHVRTLQDRRLWIWALVPVWGAARFSAQYLLSMVDVSPQDPVLTRVFSIQEVPLRADSLVGAGVPSWAVELTARGVEHEVAALPEPEQRRADFPRDPVVRRASMQAALEAAKPQNLVQTLSALDADVLASSTVSSNASRVRMYETICRIAEVEAWPVSQRSVRIFAACLKQGHYKSVKIYFSAVLGHQMRTMGMAVPPEVQRCITDSSRAALRGAGPSKLKDYFHVPVLRKVIRQDAGAEGFSPGRPDHMADVLLVCCWFMFREIEASASQVCHVYMNTGANEVSVMLPVQKTDSRGLLCTRTLKCACRVSRQDLCPFHAMKRHLLRLSANGHEAVSSRAPLFPDATGSVMTKETFVRHVRATLAACDVELTREFQGQELQRFTGHIARVSGAQWLHNLGVPLQMLQILGRWASLTILKYLQAAPLRVLPDVAASALTQGQPSGQGAAPWLTVSGAAGATETVVLEDSDNPDDGLATAPRLARKRKAPASGDQGVSDRAVGLGGRSAVPDIGPPLRETTCEGEVAALSLEVATMRAALEELRSQESFVVQGRSRKHHRIGVPESANVPSRWATVCGWRYGLGQFYRAASIGEADCRCRRCFPECFDRAEGSDLESGGSDESSACGAGNFRVVGSELYDFDGDFGKIGRAVAFSGHMTSSSAGDSMDALASQAGAGSVVRKYLEARGIRSVGTLAMVARDEDGFEDAIVRPLVSGFDHPDGRLELTAEEAPIARAVLLYMFHLAKETRQATAAVATTPGTPASSPAVAGGTKTNATEKAPRTLPPKVWSEAVNRYNEITIAGCKREFPVRRLLGAESVMARFHWEHTVSRCYTPLELGELISKRSFTSTNEVNHLATKKRPTKLQFDGESLQTEEDSTWEPRSLWAVVDGLDAIRWCHILFQVGEEMQINLFFEEMICRARQRPNKVEIFREYYAAVSWRICMALNTGRTYKEATDDILNDVIMWNEYMAREPKEDKKRKRPEASETISTQPWLPKPPLGGKTDRQIGNGSVSHGSARRGDGTMAVPTTRGDLPPVAQDDPPPPVSMAAASQAATASSRPSWFPLRGDSASPVPGLQNHGDLILLTFFDGVGSSVLALQSLGIRIRATLEWEIDEAALKVSSQVYKGLRMKRGDITMDDPEAVAKIVGDMLREKDSAILVTAAPPCTDYSAVNGSAEGREGASGSLFVTFVHFITAVEKALGRRLPMLVENVLMQNGTDTQWFGEKLQAEPIIADSAAFGMISRPRTWWSRIDWTRTTQHPYRPDQPLKWDKFQGLRRLLVAAEKDRPDSFSMPGLSFHASIQNGSRTLPCLTTPAPSAEGRPPPKRMKGKLSAQARQRWLSGHRQYAPWVYEDHALVFEKSGEGQLLPAELTEQLHHYPAGLTRCESVTPKDRHRLLGNSWHLGIARILIALVLLSNIATVTAFDDRGLDFFLAEAKNRALPVAGHLSTATVAAVEPSHDMLEQWWHSLDLTHPLLVKPKVEPAVERTMQDIVQLGPAVVHYREQAVAAVKQLKVEMQAETTAWFQSLPEHVARAYSLEDNQVVQIPMFMRLLRGCGYPDCDNLEADLNRGFPLLGTLRRSPGWHTRTDDWYDHPVTEEVFSSLNCRHIRQRAKAHKADPEWECMLKEVLQERDQGRIQGPFRAHESWGFRAVATDGDDLVPMPSGPAYAAFAFSVVQEGSDGSKKVRRCEDYRRSHHNSTIKALDKPPHDSVESYVRILLAWAFLGILAQVWCQDLMAAYRQYPVLAVAHAYMLLQLPQGISVWRHAVLPFGASASVWHFNRCTEQLPSFLQKVLGVWLAVSSAGIEDSLTPEEASWAGQRYIRFTRGPMVAVIRFIPVRSGFERTSVAYADAYFKMGETAWKVGHAQPRHWTRQPVAKLQNGWGFIVRHLHGTTAGFGQVPAEVVSKYGSRKAYIFFLEVNAQVLALLANHRNMGPFWVGFIDNKAGKAALSRGFTADSCINNLLCFFWSLCAELKWFAHFEWVASHLNPADPISRGDPSIATQLQACSLQGVPNGYWRLLMQIADDMQYACGQAVSDALNLEFSFA
ncbi:DNA (cytosine-5)-methyltransferase 3A [Symbiodinium microadriaticum]|uniref:DNA (Cytosine-5)-methyltransferase 3A n=1 Tax=Symbiodinium microadriaticum TaxID=2951 RepID=A0A1Q9CTM6_SYMMI|nr:DNA (cytosine-5)-methyltransferase 3A [Symbiodinium microadriaticum]